jgi:hypothetical protein
VTDLPGPEQLETLAVPANDRFRFDDDQGRSPIAPDFAQPAPEESISGCQFRPFHRTTQDAELVSECEVFQLKGRSRFQGYGHGGSQHVKHAERRVEELMEAAQVPCSHSIRCLRYPPSEDVDQTSFTGLCSSCQHAKTIISHSLLRSGSEGPRIADGSFRNAPAADVTQQQFAITATQAGRSSTDYAEALFIQR